MTENKNPEMKMKKDYCVKANVTIPISVLEKSIRYKINRSGTCKKALIVANEEYEKMHPELREETP
jgi:post-segregation antitoxin (ccd killing protein)